MLMLHIHVVIEVVSYLFILISFLKYHIYDWIGHQNSERNDISETSTRGNHNRGARGNTGANNYNKRSDNGRGKGHRAPPFDNKYGVDLSLCKS